MKIIGASSTLTPQAREIIKVVALERGVSMDLIRGNCRWREVVLARAEVARQLTKRGYSGTRIGAMLNKDHSTILYYLGRRKRQLKLRPTDPPLSDWEDDEMKLTPAQRDELIRRAEEGGYGTSKDYAREIGVSPNYGLVLLKRTGRKPRRHSERWARAVAAGPVSV